MSESENDCGCRIQLFATPWTGAHQAPLSTGFATQEYCSGFPFSSPGDLPDPGIEPGSPALQADSLSSKQIYRLNKLYLFQRSQNCITGRGTQLPLPSESLLLFSSTVLKEEPGLKFGDSHHPFRSHNDHLMS